MDLKHWGLQYSFFIFTYWKVNYKMFCNSKVLTSSVPDSSAGSHWERGSGFGTSIHVWWCLASGPDQAGSEGGAQERQLVNWILRAGRQADRTQAIGRKPEGQITCGKESDEDKPEINNQKKRRKKDTLCVRLLALNPWMGKCQTESSSYL